MKFITGTVKKGKDYKINPENSRDVIKILIHDGRLAKNEIRVLVPSKLWP